jgi:transposase
MDMPWGTRPIRLQLTGRNCVCRHPSGLRRRFTERLPELVAAYARTTHRRVTARQAIGVARGGQVGACLTHRVGVPVGRDTLVRLVRCLPLPAISPLRTVGVDALAHRQRQRDGTIRVDLAQRRPVALLHDREVDTLAHW